MRAFSDFRDSTLEACHVLAVRSDSHGTVGGLASTARSIDFYLAEALQLGARCSNGTVWVQPPVTPEVGMAMVEVYEKTIISKALQAAQATAECLVKGQLQSGAWNDKIEFGQERQKIVYRTDGPLKTKAFNFSTFDDDKTQSAVRFYCNLKMLRKDGMRTFYESLQFALKSILADEFHNAAFAKYFQNRPTDRNRPI